jgi:hypothetical protein
MIAVLITLALNIAVALAFLYFGANPATAWFTFLALCGLAGLAEIGRNVDIMRDQLNGIAQDKLDRMLRPK